MIVIFGAGFIGQIVSMILEKVYEKDFVVVDNDKAIQGTFFNCHLILLLYIVFWQAKSKQYIVFGYMHKKQSKSYIKIIINIYYFFNAKYYCYTY